MKLLFLFLVLPYYSPDNKTEDWRKKIKPPLEIEIIREITRPDRLMDKLMTHPLPSLLVRRRAMHLKVWVSKICPYEWKDTTTKIYLIYY